MNAYNPVSVSSRPHRMQSWPPVRSHCAEKGEADAEVVQQVSSCASQIRLLVLEVPP